MSLKDIWVRNLLLNSDERVDFEEQDIIPTTVEEYLPTEGGRNLILDSNKELFITDITPTGSQELLRPSAYKFESMVEQNTTYTLSIRFRGLGTNATLRPHIAGTYRFGIFPVTDEFTTHTATITTRTFQNNVIHLYGLNVEEIEIEWIKVEKGDTPTDWTPAPEDFNNLKGKSYALSKPLRKENILSLNGSFEEDDFIGLWLGNDKFVGFLDNQELTFDLIENYDDDFVVVKTLSEKGIIDNATLVRDTPTLDIINQNIKDKDDKFITIDGTTYFKDVLEVKRSVSGSLYQSNMTMLEVSIKGYFDVLDEWITYDREIASRAVNDGESEFIHYGQFKVTSCVYNDDTETTTIIAFDKMIETQKEYRQEDMQVTFPTTVGIVFNRVLQVCGLETTTTTFPNSDELISEDVWANASYTYRDVLSHIAQVSGSIIGVKDDKIEVYQPTDTGFTINQSKLSALQMGENYGKINILNLTREPQHDNYAYPTDFNTIPQNERKELVFENNPIVDKERERWAPLIFPLVNDLEYREFTAEAFVGYGIFDVGDIVTVQEYNTNESYTCLITDEYTTHTQGMSGEVKSNKPFASKEQYVVVTDERREGQITYILVDQLNGQIILATEKIDELEDKATELELDIDGLMARVETIHNGNVIPNLNGELGYYGWRGAGSELVFTDDLIFAEDMRFENAFVPKQMEGSLSDWGISIYGKNRSPLGRVIPNMHYSWRGKAIKFLPFDITVIEYAEDKTVLQNTVYNFTNPSTYLQFTHEPDNDTRYIALEFNSPTATYTNRLELSEMMFNRGEPKEWFESSDSVKIWAESMFEIQDNMIQSTVREVQTIDGRVVQNESSITQLSDEISLKADKIELEGKVGFSDLTTEGRTEISGSNITTGTISANRINFNGAKGSNVDLSGKITADSGKIGGYTISGDNLVGNDVTLGINQVQIGQATFSSELISGMPNTLDIDSNYVNIGQLGTSRLFLGRRTFSIVSDTLGIALGTNNNPINYIYLENQPIVTSDLRRKHSIQDIPKELIDEIVKVEPKMYLQHKTWHFGYIAQDIERALYKWATNKYGREAKHYVDKFAFLHKDESHLSLLYGEIAVLKEKAMSDRITKLEEELREIKELLKERND